MASQQSQEDENNEQVPANNDSSANNNASTNNNASDNGRQEMPVQQALLTSRRDLARTYTRTLQDVNTDISTLVQESNTIIQQTIQRTNETLQQVMQRIDATFNRMARDVDANDEALLQNLHGRLASPSIAPPLPHNRPHVSDDELNYLFEAPEVVQPQDVRRPSRSAGPSPDPQREEPDQPSRATDNLMITAGPAGTGKRKPGFGYQTLEESTKSMNVDTKPEHNLEAIIGDFNGPRRTRSSKAPAPALPKSIRNGSTGQLSASNTADTTATSKRSNKQRSGEMRVSETFEEAQVNHPERPAAGQATHSSKRRKRDPENDNHDPVASTTRRPNTKGKRIKEEFVKASAESSSSRTSPETGASPDTFERRMANVPDNPNWDEVMQGHRADLGDRAPTVTNSEGAHRYSTQR